MRRTEREYLMKGRFYFFSITTTSTVILFNIVNNIFSPPLPLYLNLHSYHYHQHSSQSINYENAKKSVNPSLVNSEPCSSSRRPSVTNISDSCAVAPVENLSKFPISFCSLAWLWFKLVRSHLIKFICIAITRSYQSQDDMDIVKDQRLVVIVSYCSPHQEYLFTIIFRQNVSRLKKFSYTIISVVILSNHCRSIDRKLLRSSFILRWGAQISYCKPW